MKEIVKYFLHKYLYNEVSILNVHILCKIILDILYGRLKIKMRVLNYRF